MEKPFLLNNLKLDEEALRKIFVFNLNQIHLILLYLTECLPLIAKATCYGDLENIINEEILSDVKVQLFRISDIFMQLNIVPNQNCPSKLNELLPNLNYKYEYEQMDSLSKDLSIVFYLQKLLSIKENHFQILKSIANSLNSINIKSYLQYNCDECKNNKEMLTLVAKDYIESNINTFLR